MIFDIAPQELLVLGAVALLVIPPKDLPKAMRIAGQWVGRARGMARTFRSGFDDMIRESEFKEMEAKWKAENERIMREFPSGDDHKALMAPVAQDVDDAALAHAEEMAPATVAQPVTKDDPSVAALRRKPAATSRARPTATPKPAAEPKTVATPKAAAKPRATKAKS